MKNCTHGLTVRTMLQCIKHLPVDQAALVQEIHRSQQLVQDAQPFHIFGAARQLGRPSQPLLHIAG